MIVSAASKISNERFLPRTFTQVARKYLDGLQEDMIGQVDERKGSKKVHIKTPHFEFDFPAKRTLDETGEKGS
jgi:hypothetical protein